MEIVEMNLFDVDSGTTTSKNIEFSECLEHTLKSDKLVTSLDESICGEYNTILNKALTMSFKLKALLTEDFYNKYGYDINKLTADSEELMASVYYNALACTIITEMYDYISEYGRLVFSYNFDDASTFFSEEELIRIIVHKLRNRKINAVKNLSNNEYYIYVNSIKESVDTTLNNVTDGAGYLKDIVFADIDLNGLPIVDINVSEFTNLLTLEKYEEIYNELLNNAPLAKQLMKNLVEVCNMLNDTQYSEILISRGKQLNETLILLFKSVIDFTGITITEEEQVGNLEYLNVKNKAKELCNVCISNGLHFEKYKKLCDVVDRLILFTDNFKEQPEELSDEDFKIIVRKLMANIAEMYKDVVRMFVHKGKITVYSPVEKYKVW